MNTEPIETLPFDPSKTYSWEGNASFILSGKQLEILLNSSQIDAGLTLSHPQWSVKQAAMQVIETLVRQGYANGIVIPIVEPDKM